MDWFPWYPRREFAGEVYVRIDPAPTERSLSIGPVSTLRSIHYSIPANDGLLNVRRRQLDSRSSSPEVSAPSIAWWASLASTRSSAMSVVTVADPTRLT